MNYEIVEIKEKKVAGVSAAGLAAMARPGTSRAAAPAALSTFVVETFISCSILVVRSSLV